MPRRNSTEKPRLRSRQTEYRFRVRKLDDGSPWIVLEPRRKTLEVLGRGLLGLDLKLGTSFEEAENLADHLNQHVACVARVKSWVEMSAPTSDPVLARFRTAIENRPIRDRALLRRLDPLGAVQRMDALAAETFCRDHEKAKGEYVPPAKAERH